jgi:hypothetical protein
MNHATLDRLVQRLSFEVSDIDAVALGGSLGRQSSDEYSDADIFLLVPNEATTCAVAAVDHVVCTTLSVVARSCHASYSGFGLRESYIDDKGEIYELFINSKNTIDRDPIRAGMRIIHDKSGWLSEYCRALERTPDYSIRYDRIVFDYLNTLNKCLKYVARGHLIQALGRLINLTQTAISLGELMRIRTKSHAHGFDRKCMRELESIGYATNQFLPSENSASTIAEFALRRSIFVIGLLRNDPEHSHTYKDVIKVAEHLNTSLAKHAYDLDG